MTTTNDQRQAMTRRAFLGWAALAGAAGLLAPRNFAFADATAPTKPNCGGHSPVA